MTSSVISGPIPWMLPEERWDDRFPVAAHWMSQVYNSPAVVRDVARSAGWQRVCWWDSETEGVILSNDRVTVLAGRGTDFRGNGRLSLRDLWSDAQHWRRGEAVDLGIPAGVRYAVGSLNHLRREWSRIEGAALDHMYRHGHGKGLFITGHSLFAGVAEGPLTHALCARGVRDFTVFAFEPPRTAGPESKAVHGEVIEASGVKVYSIRSLLDGVGDLITLLPPKSWPFQARHCGERVMFIRRGSKSELTRGSEADSRWLDYKEVLSNRWIRRLPQRIAQSVTATHSAQPITDALIEMSSNRARQAATRNF